MKGVFTLAGPRLDWRAMVGMLRLVWLRALRFLGKAALRALGLVPFPVSLQDAVVVLQLNILGVKMVTPLGHLDDTGAEELHLSLEIDLHRQSPLGGTLLGGTALGISAILSRHG
ncbi:unnamed protein product [Prunus armeniaca]